MQFKETLDVVDALPKLYLPFAGYVIQTRALPDARDGLKSGARYILYAQYLDKLTYDKPRRKAVATVNATMNFSVHGDASIYGNAIRMSQEFSLRYPVIDTKGSNGSMVYGDDYSAPRYVEMRGGQIASDMTSLLSKNTVDKWRLNYTQEKKYPTVLPSKFPFSLVNGNTGIGVGCGSSIPQFNINDVCNALLKLLDNPDVSFEEIYCPIDFATGGTIINESQVKESLQSGHGKAACIRAKIEYNIDNNELVVTEMPYQTFTSTVVMQIQNAIDENLLSGVEMVFDGTDQTGVRICVKLTKNAVPEKVVKQLYKATSLQSYYGINMQMLKDGKIPMLFNWKMMMETYLAHLSDIMKKAFLYDLNQLQDKLEILEGYVKALENIDNIVDLIKKSKTTAEASDSLMEKYKFSERQAEAILDLKLQRLTNMETIKINNNIEDLKKKVDTLSFILSNRKVFQDEVRNEILSIQKKYKDARRTINMDLIIGEDEHAEPVEKKNLIVYLTNFGNIHTSETTTLMIQKRGGKGNKIKLNKGEYIIETVTDTNYGTAMIFSNLGKIYTFNLDELPVNDKINLHNMFELVDNEIITNLISYNKLDEYKYILFTTKSGLVKKSLLSEYKIKKSKGVLGLKLKENDELVNISFINEEPLAILTKNGQFLVIDSSLINPVGRIAMGVKGVKLNEEDFVIDAQIFKESPKEIISISKKGLTKRTLFEEFGISTRYTKGVQIQKQKENDSIIGFKPLYEKETEVIIVSSISTIKLNVSEISLSSKGSLGAMSMKLNESEFIVNIIESI